MYINKRYRKYLCNKVEEMESYRRTKICDFLYTISTYRKSLSMILDRGFHRQWLEKSKRRLSGVTVFLYFLFCADCKGVSSLWKFSAYTCVWYVILQLQVLQKIVSMFHNTRASLAFICSFLFLIKYKKYS